MILNAIVDSGAPQLMTLREVAAYLRVSYKTVWRMVKKGELLTLRPGNKHLVQRTELARVILRKKG